MIDVRDLEGDVEVVDIGRPSDQLKFIRTKLHPKNLQGEKLILNKHLYKS